MTPSRIKRASMGAHALFRSHTEAALITPDEHSLDAWKRSHHGRILPPKHEVEIKGIHLGDEGAHVLAEELKSDAEVRCLTLVDNRIGPDGAFALARALLKNETLNALDIRQNPIGDNGVRSFAVILASNVTLMRLSIYTNTLSAVGAQHIAGLLEKNNTLQKLSLFSNSLDDEVADRFCEALRSNRALRKLSIYSSALTDVGASRLKDAFEKETRLLKISLSPSQSGERRTCQRNHGGTSAHAPSPHMHSEGATLGPRKEMRKQTSKLLSLQYGTGPLTKMSPIDQQRQAEKARLHEEESSSDVKKWKRSKSPRVRPCITEEDEQALTQLGSSTTGEVGSCSKSSSPKYAASNASQESGGDKEGGGDKEDKGHQRASSVCVIQ